MLVNIYIYQTIRGPGKKAGAYTYILETEINNKTATLTDTGLLEPMTENKAELKTLLKALKRLRGESDLVIFTESQYIKIAIDEWIDKWIHDNWKNAKGKEIANIEEWQQVKAYKDKHKMQIVHCKDMGYSNTYKKWMIAEADKRMRGKNDECV